LKSNLLTRDELMSRATPLDKAIDSSMHRAKRHLAELTAVQNDYLIVAKQLQARPSASRLKMQVSGLEDKALNLAKALSQDFQGCKSHKDFPIIFREFTKKLKSLQQDLNEASVRQQLKKLTPDEIDFPLDLSSSIKSQSSHYSSTGNFLKEAQSEVINEPYQSRPIDQSLEQKYVFKPLGDSKKRKNDEVKAIARDVNTIAQTFEELKELVNDQQLGIDDIQENTDSARQSIDIAKRNIFQASKYHSNLVYTIGGTVIGGLVGGPVGAAALGLKAGLGIGIGTSVLGGILGRKKSQIEKRKIDDELREPWNPQESHTELSIHSSPPNEVVFEQQ